MTGFFSSSYARASYVLLLLAGFHVDDGLEMVADSAEPKGGPAKLAALTEYREMRNVAQTVMSRQHILK